MLNSDESINNDSLFPKGRILAILFIVWLSLFAGINSIPLETHEAYVLQTAREMALNNNLVLPYFNQEPRLNKPPLNYWLTLGISYLDPISSDIEPWHGRVWSMIGALLLVIMTSYIGNKLYGAPTGFLASALLLGTKGFTDFSHDARPDFLYSVLCVMQLFALIFAWRAQDDSRSQRIYAGLAWGLAGIATLTKGPQVPAVFLLGFLLFMLSGAEPKRTLKVVRPFSGLLICLSLTIPWWMLLNERIRMLGLDLGKTQLSGSLLTMTSSWKEILSFFYVSRLLNLLLPVSLLLPLLFFMNRKRLSMRSNNIDRLFLYVILTMIVVFTIAGHYRARNMLPLLPIVSLLLAAAVTRITDDHINVKIWRVLLFVGGVSLLVCPVLLIIKQQYATSLLVLGTGFLLALLLRKELSKPVWLDNPLAAKLLVCFLLVTLFFAGFNAYSIRSDRIWNRDFSLSVARNLQPGDLLLAIGSYPAVLPYYAHHVVVNVNGIDELRKYYEINGSGANVYLLVQQSMLADVKKEFETTTPLAVGHDENPDKKIVFAKLLNIRP